MVKTKRYQRHLPSPSQSNQKSRRKFIVEGQSQALDSPEGKIFPNSTVQSPPQTWTGGKTGREGRFWQLCLLWLTASLGLLGSGLISLLWLLKPPPLDCQNLSLLASDGERLYCLEQITTSENPASLATALKVVESWTETHPLYAEAQRLRLDWSQRLLTTATEKFNQGDLKEAIDLANQIPVNSPLYPEAQVTIATWLQEWQHP